MIGLVTMGYEEVSRVGKLGSWVVEKGYCYYLLAGACWGVVMWLFEVDRGVLQTSLSNSMHLLYKESDSVEHWTDLIPYYPKNKKRSKISRKSSNN